MKLDLNIRACTELDTTALLLVAQYCKNLKRINFSCIKAGFQGLKTLIEELQYITVIPNLHLKSLDVQFFF